MCKEEDTEGLCTITGGVTCTGEHHPYIVIHQTHVDGSAGDLAGIGGIGDRRDLGSEGSVGSGIGGISDQWAQ